MSVDASPRVMIGLSFDSYSDAFNFLNEFIDTSEYDECDDVDLDQLQSIAGIVGLQAEIESYYSDSPTVYIGEYISESDLTDVTGETIREIHSKLRKIIPEKYHDKITADIGVTWW